MSLEQFNSDSPQFDTPYRLRVYDESRTESRQHFERKMEIAQRLEDDCWDVEVEKEVRTGNVVDIYATVLAREVVIEVGTLDTERRETLEDEFHEVYNVPYEVAGEEVVGDKTRGDVLTKSISFTDEHYFRLMETKPEDMTFSSWAEFLAIEGLNARQNGADSTEAN